MTVPNENNELQVVLSTTTQVIPTTFYFLETDNLTVKNTDQATIPVTTTLVETTDYVVTLPATVGGTGSITMVNGTVGDTITIIRCLDATQLVDYVANDAFPAEVHEKALDRLTMLVSKVWNALFGTNKRFIHYPDTEFGTPTVTPSLTDRIAGGAGTVFGWNAVDGSPDVISKGTLATPLTLSNSSTLSRPSSDPVNGATQDAINTNFESTWTGVGGLNGNGAYVAKSGTNFIDGNADLNEDITDLDTILQCVYNGANDLNTRTTALQGASSEVSMIVNPSVINSGTGADTGYQTLNVGAAPDGKTMVQIHCRTSISSSSGRYHLSVKDSKGNEFDLAYANANTTAGNAAADGDSSIFLEASSGGTMQVKLVVDSSGGSPSTQVTWSIKRAGWI